jgi:hypothetical protein
MGLRLPKREEMKFVGPFIQATATPSGMAAPAPGEVWFAADGKCAKPYYKNGNGQGEEACDTDALELLPYVGDRPVVCVGKGGPIVVNASP